MLDPFPRFFSLSLVKVLFNLTGYLNEDWLYCRFDIIYNIDMGMGEYIPKIRKIVMLNNFVIDCRTHLWGEF